MSYFNARQQADRTLIAEEQRRKVVQGLIQDVRRAYWRAASAQGLAGEARCAVELTTLRTGGQSWWSLGFEATGPADLLRGALEATATLVFDQPLPDGLRPGLEESTSYAEWVRHHPREVTGDSAP